MPGVNLSNNLLQFCNVSDEFDSVILQVLVRIYAKRLIEYQTYAGQFIGPVSPDASTQSWLFIYSANNNLCHEKLHICLNRKQNSFFIFNA